MRIKLLTAITIAGVTHPADSEIETDRDTAMRWIRDRQAVPVAAKRETAVVKAPERRKK